MKETHSFIYYYAMTNLVYIQERKVFLILFLSVNFQLIMEIQIVY